MRKSRLLSMEGNTSSPESTTVPSTPWIIDTVLLILLILLIFLLFLCYLMPSFLYNASGFLQPSSIKKCVNYFDVLLIIIAISSHLLSRYGSRSSSDTTSDRDNEIVNSQADTYSSKERFYDAQQKFGKVSLKRISNSYPDLRNESLWRIEEYGSRFFDDFDVDTYRPVQVADHCSCARRRRKKKVDSSVKEIPVDNFVVHPPTPPKSPPPEESVVPIQTSHIQDKKIKPQLKSTDIWNFSEEFMSKRSGMKKSSSAKELATAIASSFISQREKKRKQKMRNLHSSQSESSLSVTMEPDPSPSKVPPPPPPPPPLPSIFYNLFKRGRKPKRIQTVKSAPPPPPPPPQRSVLNNLSKNGNVSKQLQLVPASTPPPYVSFNNTFQSGSESKRLNSASSPSSPPSPLISKKKINYNEGNQSGAVHIQLLLPPPPPLSELELADEMNSAGNGNDGLPYFGSPPVEEDVNNAPSTIESTSGRDVSSGWMICPTPDVNMKAESFIARLRGEWKEDGDHEFLEGGRKVWDLGP